MNAQERSAAGQMILDSGASCLDQLGRARVGGIPDIDDQQSAAPWLGEATFHLLGDVDGKPEVLDDAGDACGGRREAMPLICVRSAAADHENVRHRLPREQPVPAQHAEGFRSPTER